MPRFKDLSTQRAIGRVIREQRLRLRMAQPEFAEQLGISQSQLQKYEVGLTRISVEALLRVAAAVGTTAPALIEEAVGTAATGTMVGSDREVVTLVRAYVRLPRHQRDAVRALVHGLVPRGHEEAIERVMEGMRDE